MGYDADYCTGGMSMPGRTFTANGSNYRYSFNGKEDDKDITDGGQDYGARIYDKRLGRFLSVDPLSNSYPWYTPYQFAGNNPIRFIDIDGQEPGDPLNPSIITPEQARVISAKIENYVTSVHQQGMQNVSRAEQARKMAIGQGRLNGDGITLLTKAEVYLSAWWFGGGANRVVPGSSNIEDGKDAIKYFHNGQYAMMSMSIFFALPEIGNISKAFKGLAPELKGLIKVTGRLEKASKIGKELITITKTGKFEDALKLARGLSEVGDDAVKLTGKFGSQEEKVVGFISMDGKRSFRVDYDAEKGAHINWTNGKEKGAVPFNGNQDVVDKMIKNEVPKTFNQ